MDQIYNLNEASSTTSNDARLFFILDQLDLLTLYHSQSLNVSGLILVVSITSNPFINLNVSTYTEYKKT
jgi:hypothetical protein